MSFFLFVEGWLIGHKIKQKNQKQKWTEFLRAHKQDDKTDDYTR